jgi:hypothetical protein
LVPPKLPFPLQAHEPQSKPLWTLPKNRLAIKIDQAFPKDRQGTKKAEIRIASVERVVRMECTRVALEEKIVKSGKMDDSGATTIKKMETRNREELATEKGIVQDGILSRARTV